MNLDEYWLSEGRTPPNENLLAANKSDLKQAQDDCSFTGQFANLTTGLVGLIGKRCLILVRYHEVLSVREINDSRKA